MTIAFHRQRLYVIEILKSHGAYHYQLPGSNSHHGPSVAHHMQLPPQGQTFGDVEYPVSSTGSVSYRKQMSTPHFFSNTMAHTAENGGMHTPTGAAPPQPFYPPSTSSQLPPSSAEHFSPPTTSYHHQHSASPPTQLPQPTSTPDLSYSQPPHPAVSTGVPHPDSTTYPTYPTSAGHFAVTSTTSDSEQRMVSELIMSISDSSPPQQQLYSPPQQPHNASSVHSNRSPSALYPSPPNSETLQQSTEAVQQNGMTTVPYPHASPPSLTQSPESRDEGGQNIATIEGLVQLHEYPALYGGDTVRTGLQY